MLSAIMLAAKHMSASLSAKEERACSAGASHIDITFNGRSVDSGTNIGKSLFKPC